MLVALIVTELVTAAVGGLMTFRILSDLEGRLSDKLTTDYGHDVTSDISFSTSLDFAQYKVRQQSSFFEIKLIFSMNQIAVRMRREVRC